MVSAMMHCLLRQTIDKTTSEAVRSVLPLTVAFDQKSTAV
jgi:hypothetical protein